MDAIEEQRNKDLTNGVKAMHESPAANCEDDALTLPDVWRNLQAWWVRTGARIGWTTVTLLITVPFVMAVVLSAAFWP